MQLTQHMYDNANRLTSQSWQFGGDTFRQSYTYTGQNSDGKQVDGTISAVTTTLPDGQTITASYKYTGLRQLWQRRTSLDGKEQFLRNYAYAVIAEDDGCNRIGTRIAYAAYRTPDGKLLFGYQYTYDTAGNISGVTTMPSERDNITQAYTYDALGQLTTETTGASTRTYAYDTAGNIRSITKDGTVTKSFGYTNPSWPDLLTSVTANGTTKDVLYEGQTQTSDLPSSGNPVTYYNGKDYSFTWTKGRQLASATVDGKQVSYAYDMAGVRSGKQVGDTTYAYTTLSGKVMRQQWDGKTLEFVYDDSSQPFAMIYKHGSETELYYYLVSAQGDVSAILDSSGKIAASYDYDAWGNCTVYNSSDAAIGDLNPLRYRGYYYDAETGFYYLQSRYYDPAICRFINADGLFADGFIGTNLFAYCVNNPVNAVDYTGNFAITATVALITFGVALVATVLAVGISSSPDFQGALDDACKTAVSAVNTAVSAGRSAVSAVSDALTKQKAKRNNAVYRLVDADGQVQYVGRTTNVEARKAAHQRNPNRSSLKFEIIAPGLSYYEARGLEQIAMIEYHTINTKNRMNNQINGISPSNKLLVIYMEAGRGVAAYLENQISNEALYWAGR